MATLESVTGAFGSNLKRERKRRGLTQAALAALSGVQDSEIGRLERGLRDARLTTIARLARGLDMPVAELLRGVDRDVKPEDVQPWLRRSR